MMYEKEYGKMQGKGIWLDPRTKGVLLIICILSAALSPSISYNCGMVLLSAFVGLMCGKIRYSVLGGGGYVIICILSAGVLQMEPGTLQTMLIAAFGLFHKVYPCGMLSGVLISTTKVSEFLCAMNKIHAPKVLTVSIAVMLRYVPTIREDWHYIKDAMELRDVSPSLLGIFTHPGRTVECVYVPLLMAASGAADELSIAAATRGIENPGQRTCLARIRFGVMDILAVLGFLVYFLTGQFCREVFL